MAESYKEWQQDLISNEGQRFNGSKRIVDPSTAATTERLACAQQLAQFGNEVLTLRAHLKQTEQEKRDALLALSEKDRAPKSEKEQEDVEMADQKINREMDLPREKLLMSQLTPDGYRLIEKILLHSHLARTQLKNCKVQLSQDIKKQYKKQLSPTEKNMKKGYRLVRDAFIWLIGDLKDILKEWKRKAITAVLADEFHDAVVYGNFILIDDRVRDPSCPRINIFERIAPKETLFTYSSPRLKHSHVVWEYVKFQLPQGYYSPKWRRLIRDTAMNKFASTATEYMLKLDSLWTCIQ